ncbi:hypothetical protein AUC45_02625 [Erythrobacter sp. YT30]|nr:hypothetical protein AUC45_02625 [Erythrobacter sp. YT30]
MESSGLLQQERDVSFTISVSDKGFVGAGGPFEGAIEQSNRIQNDGSRLLLANYRGLPASQLQLIFKSDSLEVTWMVVDYRSREGEGIIEAQGDATCSTQEIEKVDLA